MLAVLLAALAPTISHALSAQGRGLPWAEVCSAGSATPPGGKTLGDPASADEAGKPKHCGYCTLTASAPPPATTGAAPLLRLRSEAVRVAFAAAVPAAAWTSARPRAPPTSALL